MFCFLYMARHYSLVMVEVEIVYDSLEIKIFLQQMEFNCK